MTSNDELQEVATTSGALEGPGKVNVGNPATLALCQLPLTPELKLIIAGFLCRFSEFCSGVFLLTVYTIRKPEKSMYFKIRCLMTPG